MGFQALLTTYKSRCNDVYCYVPAMYRLSAGQKLFTIGERTVRIRKVESSILFVSTKKEALSKDSASFLVSVGDWNARRK